MIDGIAPMSRRHASWLAWCRGIWTRKEPILAGALCLMAAPAAAAGDLWDFFEARCLVPYEHLALPDTRGLEQGADGLWSAPGGFALDLTPETCTATGGPVTAALADALMGRQAYEEVEPGIWHSHLWREPRIELEVTSDGYVVRETDLES